MRWEEYGWQLCRITDIITNATPRVFKKFNYRIIWADGGSNQGASKKLSVENYRHAGQMLATSSWAILSCSIPVA